MNAPSPPRQRLVRAFLTLCVTLRMSGSDPSLHPLKKHYWEGWRQTTPQSWPGGQTLVLRHTNASTVWRENTFDPFPPATEAPIARPLPPRGILPGVQLEVFWPEGERLNFPETRFEGDVELVSVPVSRLPPRAAEMLAESVRLRPGVEPASLSAKEWEELEESLPEIECPLSIEVMASDDDRNVLRITRKTGFTEPWLCLFLTPYDGEQRFRVTTLLLTPERWTGSLPQ